MPNHPGFIEHRHDQSVFSLLGKKYAITPYRDPCQSGNKSMDEPIFKNSPYSQILHLGREKNQVINLINKRYLYHLWKTIVFDKMHYGYIHLNPLRHWLNFLKRFFHREIVNGLYKYVSTNY